MSEGEHTPTDLSTLLGGQPSEEAPAVIAPAATEPPAAEPLAEEPLAEASRTRVPKGEPGAGQFAGKEKGGEVAAVAAPAIAALPPEEATPGAPPAPDKGPVPQAVLLNERRRRQEAEGIARDLSARLEALTRLPQAQPAEKQKVEFWDDPDAAMDARFDQFGDTLLDRFEQRQLVRRVDRSEFTARQKYDDFDEAVDEFKRAAVTNPALQREMALHDDPAEFAYRKGKSLGEVATYGGDVDAMRTAWRAEWEAELRASAPPLTPDLPPSTAAERSVAVSRAGPAWTGPTPLSTLLPGG